MRRVFVLAGLILGFSVIAVSVSAQTPSTTDKSTVSTPQQSAPAGQGNFVDANKDGICDHHQNGGKMANCTQFVDKDGDGKCDNCQGKGNCVKNCCPEKGKMKADCCPKGCSQGTGMKHRHGNGQCVQSNATQPEKK